MENYTKYKLKSNDELVSLLADKDNLFVIACNKCFKEFDTVDEPAPRGFPCRREQSSGASAREDVN